MKTEFNAGHVYAKMWWNTSYLEQNLNYSVQTKN